MTSSLLRAADPAAGLHTDPDGALLDEITATPRERAPRRRARPGRLVAGGLTAAAAAVAAVLLVNPSQHGGVGAAGYTVTRDSDGTVRAVVRWSALSDPAALQAALDRAGARTKVFVERNSNTRPCRIAMYGVPYSAAAVQWHAPDDANTDDGIVVHPAKFPRGGTFVLVVHLATAGTAGGSTFAPGFPQITDTLSMMVIGPVVPPNC